MSTRNTPKYHRKAIYAKLRTDIGKYYDGFVNTKA